MNSARLQRLTGDYRAAAASQQQALGQLRDLGERSAQASALNELGLVQQLTGDYASRGRQPPAGPGDVPRSRRTATARPKC